MKKDAYIDIYTKRHNKNGIFYQSESDSDNHLFFKLEPFLLQIPHFHESIEIVYVTKGAPIAHIANVSRKLSVGDICIINLNYSHYYESNGQAVNAYVLVLGRNYTFALNQLYEDFYFEPFMTDKEKNKAIIETIMQWHGESQDDFLLNCSYADKLFYQIIKSYGISKNKSKYDMKANNIKMIEYINENFDKNLTIKQMSQDFGYSKEYFSKLFNESVGMHFNKYLNQVRMRHAIELINGKKQSKKKMSDIIFECGYNNPVTFYRQYKKYFDSIDEFLD